jgi:hypothetical protein
MMPLNFGERNMDMANIGGGRRGRIIHSLTLDAIAAVDSPCQEHAKMSIIKRAPGVHQPSGADDPAGRFGDVVSTIQKRDGCDRTNALMRAAREHPVELEAYRKAGPAADEPVGADERATARRAFMEHARGIADRHRIPLSAAMARARRDHAEDFAKAYG